MSSQSIASVLSSLILQSWFYSIVLCLCVGYMVETTDTSKFSIAWQNFTQDSQLAHATYSITILDSSTGDTIFSFNQDVGLSPASTLKTVTGAAAFHYLGADYQYRTLLQYSGSINASGYLNGYIYIVGRQPSYELQSLKIEL
jgi:serine-type D-Ala-D-Ala carboxypeptidase/endopeptidase (penicillin-binding protein 4)